MLHKLKSSYKDIAKYLPNIDKSLSVYSYQKQQLFDMAKKGKKRPSKNTKLGRALSYFIRKKSKLYDKNFEEKIKELAPEWFFIGIKSDSYGGDTKLRGGSFLGKFKLLTMLLRNKDEVFDKSKLSAMYFGNNSKIQQKYVGRIMDSFESIGLVYSCDKDGNKINLKRILLRNKFTKRFWKNSEDLEYRIGLKFKSKPKAKVWKKQS